MKDHRAQRIFLNQLVEHLVDDTLLIGPSVDLSNHKVGDFQPQNAENL